MSLTHIQIPPYKGGQNVDMQTKTAHQAKLDFYN